MSDFPDLPAHAFDKLDGAPDALFYSVPRLVTHIDARAIAAVTDLYRAILPPGGDVLDLMSSWVSHLPAEIAYRTVTGLGMNADELAANPRLTSALVQDLNLDPGLPFPDASFDAAVICVSVQYLQRPVSVLREVARTLRPGGTLAITFSDRCFPTKAVAVWGALASENRPALVTLACERAGLAGIETRRLLARDGGGDPLWAVVARAPGAAASQGRNNA